MFSEKALLFTTLHYTAKAMQIVQSYEICLNSLFRLSQILAKKIIF